MTWIACAERMPEDGKLVLTWQAGCNGQETAVWMDGDWHGVDEPSHWMPLPAPPGTDEQAPTPPEVIEAPPWDAAKVAYELECVARFHPSVSKADVRVSRAFLCKLAAALRAPEAEGNARTASGPHPSKDLDHG